MEINEYQAQAAKTAQYTGQGMNRGIVYNALKLAGEAGEISDKVGKVIMKDDLFGIFDDFTVSDDEWIVWRMNIAKELGDVMWHVAMLASDIGMTLEDICKMNGQKLKARMENDTILGSGDDR